MNDFIASNGVRFRTTMGQIKWAAPGSEVFGDLYEYASGSLLDFALAELYRGREDERLGRWRVPGHPNWVCFATPHAYEVVVLNEDEPQYGTQLLSRGSDTWPYYRAAADAYFDAHPEPKPWHDAVEGEVWALSIGDDEERAWMAEGDDPRFWRGGHSIDRRSGSITAGRRIWPEVS